MEQTQNESLHLQLIETTCILNQVINTNCAFDGSNIIYLSGSSIVYHNVFQNNKTFLQRATDNQVVAMNFHKTADLSVVLVTKSGDGQCHVQFYFLNKKGLAIDLHQDLQVSDVVFLEKKKVMIVGYDNNKKTNVLIIVTSHKKFRKIDISEAVFKLIANDRKVLILAEQGCFELIIDKQNLVQDKKYIKYQIADAILLDNDYQIVIDRNNFLFFFSESKLLQTLQLGAINQSNNRLQYQTSVRIGHNLLIAYKNQFILSYYQIGEQGVEFISNFQYCQKLRVNILSLQCSADELNLIIAAQIFHKDQFRIQHFVFNLSVLSNEKKFINPFHRIIANGAEMGDISSLQTIVPSQVYYLAGPSIINYSYIEHIEKKHKYVIHQSPKLIAVHPLGHQILCIFQTCLKFYQKIEMQLVQTWTEQMICYAARYTASGLLILSLFQDNNHQIITYNPNSFRRMRTYSGLYLKHAINKIELDDRQTELILYSGKDLFVHKLKTGQKISEFRQKKECVGATCIEYDFNEKQLLVAGSRYLLLCRKIQDYCLNFTNQKMIQVQEDITCIYIRQNIQTLFLGTADGKILFCEYPLSIKEEVQEEEKVCRVNFNSIKVHHLPIIDLLLTNNSKFLLVNVRGDGLSILKIKRASLNGKNSYNPFDISNFNFIETSSKPYLQTVQDRLRLLLQKRKTIFNELDEFKKEWESKRVAETKSITTMHKKKELSNINSTLAQIAKTKMQHQSLLDGLAQLQIDSQKRATDGELQHHHQLIECYEQSNQLKNKKREVENRCNQEYQTIMEQCHQNIQQIKSQLQLKFEEFQSNYVLMKQNLKDFSRRLDIEAQENQILRNKQIDGMRTQLKRQQEDLQKQNSELKGQISKSKKQLQRFMNRKDFLENKMRFFVEQLKYCHSQQSELLDIKEELDSELIELEDVTHKKEKRLRKYFIQNEILIKYQLIHDNLLKQGNRQSEFIEQQHQKVKNSINELQLQILRVANEREAHSVQLARKSKQLQDLKDSRRQLKQKYFFLQLQIQQMSQEMEAVNSDKVMDDQAKKVQYMAIYNNYFVNKKLQAVINSQKTKDSGGLAIQNRRKQEKIKEVLQEHRDYLLKNMNLFHKYNSRIIDEINLSYLKHQTDNYNLISECNVRKEQSSKNKRIFHQMNDSIKHTTKYINKINRNSASRPKHSESDSCFKQIPFVSYEQAQDEQLREREKLGLRSEKSESSLWNIKKQSCYQVRKMLETQKMKRVAVEKEDKHRRIQTATLKKKPLDSSHEQAIIDESIDVMAPVNYQLQPRKPLTAAGRRPHGVVSREGRGLLSRNKSNSKPTSCTSHSKYSVFM